ncbi:unnamed protein product [Vitrella brassicaformis CCMP3155]|uniref:dihydropyrimidinase n=2 Tax=Vitrella brassicaformis TaxID=1169539 RepID=A0A0G4EMW9_VITBC|nr:unnamed protein product [Vitrella brassicaformis CCMP3155]|eukprot:CEL99172.1 unnamed protein product [Vitrella brassicaformis CCMP3155]
MAVARLLSLVCVAAVLCPPSVVSQTCKEGDKCSEGGGGKLLIKGGIVVNEDVEMISDILIDNGHIQLIATEIAADSETRVVDARGKYVMPGGIDPHTHLEMPFMGEVACDTFATGHQAALAGGTTMHIDFALPVDGSLVKGWEEWRKKAAKANMDYGFHMAVTAWNDKVAEEMEYLAKNKGVNSYKFFMAYKGALMVTDEQLVEGFRHCKKIGALAQVHAENGDAVAAGQKYIAEELQILGPEGHALSRPAILEVEATERAINLAAWVNTPLYVVHVMSKGAMEAVARARQAGYRIIGEPTAAGLTLDESKMWDPDFKTAAAHVMSPPIRKHDVDGIALQNALKNRVLSLVATDHAVFNSTQKAKGKHDFRVLPNGVNGLEERIPVLWTTMVNTGKITPMDFVRITSTEAARIFNVYPQKGVIREGSDADLYVLDPTVEYTISPQTHHSALDTNVFEGIKCRGKVVTTISRGDIVWDNNQLFTKDGRGQYIETKPFSPYLFGGLEQEEALKRAEMNAPVKRNLDKIYA